MLSLLLLPLFGLELAAHNPMETFTNLGVQDGSLSLRLELPWSISDAVKATLPETKTNLSKTESYALLTNYIGANLVISHSGKVIQPESIQELPQNHGHSMILDFKYPLESLEGVKIKNTLMFNIHPKQRNHLTIVQEDDNTSHYLLTSASPIFIAGESTPAKLPVVPVNLLLFAGIGIIFLFLLCLPSPKVTNLGWRVGINGNV